MQPTSLIPAHPEWPRGLADLAEGDGPTHLRVRGAWPPDGRLAVAIVGTRLPSAEGTRIARTLAHDLAAAGVVVWSGGAVGIDAAAHEGALEAGGATVAVLGSGLAEGFPPENAALFDRIVQSGRGALVACCEDAQKANRPRFYARNRVIAACTAGLVIVECDVRSGARNAAAAARRLGRPVGAVPYTPGSGLGRGGILELTELRARPVFTAAHVLALVGERVLTHRTPNPPPRRRGPSPPPAPASGPLPLPPRAVAATPSDPTLRGLLGHLRAGPLHVDALAHAAGLSAAATGRGLFSLAVDGLVEETAPGLWSCASASFLSQPRKDTR